MPGEDLPLCMAVIEAKFCLLGLVPAGSMIAFVLSTSVGDKQGASGCFIKISRMGDAKMERFSFGGPVKKILATLIKAGVSPGMPVRKARFVKACNLIALISTVWLIGIIPTFMQYLPATRDVTLTTTACALGLCFTPLINRFGFYRSAQVYAPTISMLTISYNALYFGHQTWNDLLLIALILIAFYYVESLPILLWITACAGALFVGVESWYVVGHRGFLEGVVPDQFLITIRNASVYNVALLTIAFAYYNRAVLNSTQRALDKESARSESLLLNILPRSIAERLKNSSELIADRIPEVSIIFADLVGFTEMSRRMDAGQLVTMLNEIFLGFDRAAKRLGLEKIKTIGDAYMVVAGVPEPHLDHAGAAAEMAVAMKAHVEALCSRYPDLRLRIGVHTGSVVAGVIGENKFAYDLWGDNVNIASRMESHGLPGLIHVSEAFVQAASGKWCFEPRGSIDVKGQGSMNTYFLSGLTAS
jgi:adenylate cyclase